ncbi:MAG: hypothetical protein FWG12_03365 [Holophagaceae bacterium]|nr:hypothetical protein [Holophagaceae bacterium]
MTINDFFHWLILVSVVWAISALLFTWRRTRAYGKRELYAAQAGNQVTGAFFAFTVAMLPWAKESIRENLFGYAMGIAYHIGTFTAIALLAAYLVPALREPLNHTIFLYFLIPFALAFGIVGGILLLIKRTINPVLRAISSKDDYIANALTTAFGVLALATLLLSRMWITRLWFVSAIILFTYLPLSKLRHCLFFFITRYHFGAFFGRRGCMPPSKNGRQYA